MDLALALVLVLVLPALVAQALQSQWVEERVQQRAEERAQKWQELLESDSVQVWAQGRRKARLRALKAAATRRSRRQKQSPPVQSENPTPLYSQLDSDLR